MSLRINHNTAALYGHRQLVKNDAAVSKNLEKLSSGLKINRAADNAAGLVISEQMRAQLNGIGQAIRNTETAVSVVQTAEGALDELNNLLSKTKALALHAMQTGTTDSAQMSADQLEFDNIVSSIDRIAKSTRFAGNNLLDGSFSAKVFQVGEKSTDQITLSIASVYTSDLGLGHFSTNGAQLSTLVLSADAASALDQVTSAINTVTNLRGKLGAIQANTLESGLSSLRASQENLTAAESTIRDVDFAEESANFTKNNILVQAATSMMAQANQLPQNVLKLLG